MSITKQKLSVVDFFIYTRGHTCFLVTSRIPKPCPFLETNKRRKIEGHFWVTSIQFAGPSWKPRPLNMKIHSLSQTWLYPVSHIRLTIVIATLMGRCALDHIIFRVFLTEKVLLKICVINASTIISNWTDMKGGHFVTLDKLIAQLIKAYSVLAELIHYCFVSLVTITCCWKSVQNLSNLFETQLQ